jgi:PAS domain S-box-containing protein
MSSPPVRSLPPFGQPAWPPTVRLPGLLVGFADPGDVLFALAEEIGRAAELERVEIGIVGFDPFPQEDARFPWPRSAEPIRDGAPGAGAPILVGDGRTGRVTIRWEGSTPGVGESLVERFLEGIAREISADLARRLVEERLRRVEQQFRLLVDTVQEGIWQTGPDWTVTYVNGRMGELLGAPADKFPGRHVLTAVHASSLDDAREALRRAEEGKQELFDLRLRRRDRKELWVLLAASPFFDAAGRFQGCLGLMTDITERKRAEEALRAADEKLRTFVEDAEDLIYFLDPQGGVSTPNPAAERFWGRETESPVLRVDRVHPEDVAAAASLPVDAEPGEAIPPLEYRLRSPSGDWLWFQSKMTAARGPENRLLGWHCVDREITERKLAEADLRLALEEKELLFQEIHHRVKNNLQMVSAIIELRGKGISDRTSIEVLDEIRAHTRAMALVHEGLYETHDLATIDLRDYLAKLLAQLETFRPASSSGAIRARIRFDGEPARLGIESAVPLGTVVTELVMNSLKHAFRGRPEAGEIRVSLRSERRHFRVSVEDDGVGLPEGLDVAPTSSFGFRLVRRLVESQLGGKLTIGSSPGKGTKAEIEFEEREREGRSG